MWNEPYQFHTLRHCNSNNNSVVLILETDSKSITRLKKFGGFPLPHSQKATPNKNKPSKIPSDLSASFVTYIQFNSFSYPAFTKQGFCCRLLLFYFYTYGTHKLSSSPATVGKMWGWSYTFWPGSLPQYRTTLCNNTLGYGKDYHQQEIRILIVTPTLCWWLHVPQWEKRPPSSCAD